jgi:CPA2 family monovalent cation:H+ antiporter-2
MESHQLLSLLLFFLGAAVIAVPLFRRFRLGAILGYLGAGVLIGPHALNLIVEPDSILHFSELGVVLLLFVIGLELNPEKLWAMRRHIFGMGLGQLLLAALVIGAVSYFIYRQANTALIIGFALALSSTAFAIQLMTEKNIIASPAGRHGFAILLLQDLAVIPILFLVQSLSPATVDQQHPWWQGVLAVAAVLVCGKFAINPLLKIVSRYGSRESMTAASLLIVVGAAYAMEMTGLSMAMGAFIAGILLANSSFRHQLESDIEPFKGLTLGLFFIAIGMTLDVGLFLQNPGGLLIAAIALMMVKTGIIACLLRFTGIHWPLGLQTALMLSQGGEFAFVVMSEASALNIFSAEVADKVSLIVGLSMALTSPLVALLGLWKVRAKTERQEFTKPTFIDFPEVLILGFGRFGQSTGRILAANRIPFIALDKNVEHIDFVKRFGNQVHYGDGTRLEVLEAAGIEKVKTVLVAIDDPDQTETIVELIRKHFPAIVVVARAHNRPNYWALRSAGAQHVVREVFHSSLKAAVSTLTAIGYNTGNALKLVDQFEHHDTQLLEQALQYRDNVDQLIELGRQGRADLERIFQQDTNRG